MYRRCAIALGAAALLATASSAAVAQVYSPPTYKADPSTYKVIFENDTFRVIAATWKPGYTDKPHSHPVPSVVYTLDNCTIKLTNPDGKTTIIHNKAGAAMAVPFTDSHTATNLGRRACHAVFVELK
jgi:hypothetical protein